MPENALERRLQLDRALERRELVANAESAHRFHVGVDAHEALGPVPHGVHPATSIQVVEEQHGHLCKLHQASLFERIHF